MCVCVCGGGGARGVLASMCFCASIEAKCVLLELICMAGSLPSRRNAVGMGCRLDEMPPSVCCDCADEPVWPVRPEPEWGHAAARLFTLSRRFLSRWRPIGKELATPFKKKQKNPKQYNCVLLRNDEFSGGGWGAFVRVHGIYHEIIYFTTVYILLYSYSIFYFGMI